MKNSNKELKRYLPNEEATLAFAEEVGKAIDTGLILFLHGPLGAGKTTFARGFLQGLGYKGKVKSPTYTLVEPYEVAAHHIFHFDFYRINDPKELEQIGIRDYFLESSICLIEWAEKGFAVLPEADLHCYLAFDGEGRKIRLVAYSERGNKILDSI